MDAGDGLAAAAAANRRTGANQPIDDRGHFAQRLVLRSLEERLRQQHFRRETVVLTGDTDRPGAIGVGNLWGEGVAGAS